MSLITYRYDGTFEGLLSAFAEAVACQDEAPDFRPGADDGAGTLFASREVPARPEAAMQFLRRLATAGGEQAPQTLAVAYLAEEPGLEAALFEYCRLTLDRNECIDGWSAHPAVRRVTGAAGRVTHELHRFKGLLRFAETTGGVYYAPYEPDHNITVPLARYFARRLADQRWIVHDRRRGLAVLWDGQSLQPGTVPQAASGSPGTEPPLSPAETDAQAQWRTYHQRVAIASRRNPRLQRQCMPRRYWGYLVEMQA